MGKRPRRSNSVASTQSSESHLKKVEACSAESSASAFPDYALESSEENTTCLILVEGENCWVPAWCDQKSLEGNVLSMLFYFGGSKWAQSFTLQCLHKLKRMPAKWAESLHNPPFSWESDAVKPRTGQSGSGSWYFRLVWTTKKQKT